MSQSSAAPPSRGSGAQRPVTIYSPVTPHRRKTKGRFSSPFFRVGLPLIAFVTVSSLILSRFLNDRFAQQRKQQQWTAVEKNIAAGSAERTAVAGLEEAVQQAVEKPAFDLEAEYQKTMAGLDLSTFENVRVPRPAQIAERTKERAALKQQQSPAAKQPLPINSVQQPD